MEFIESKTFQTIFKKLKLDDDDLRRIQNEIIVDPHTGEPPQGMHGIHKFRFDNIENKGKSGGSRIYYYVYENICYLLAIVPKNVKDNLSRAERDELVKLLNRMITNKESYNRIVEVNDMEYNTLFDYLKNGIQDIIDYKNGDTQKAKKCTVKQKQVAIEDKDVSFKLEINEEEPE